MPNNKGNFERYDKIPLENKEKIDNILKIIGEVTKKMLQNV
jgi:hypothetical protein